MGPKQGEGGWLGGLFRTKSLDAILRDSEKPEFQLRRTLGPVQLTLFGIGAIIGAGIFATIGTASAGDKIRMGAGPALMLSFVITAIVCAFTALCYAEFASMVPISGSAYTYSYATLGELVAWIIGWDLTIEYAVGNIGVAISWANYFKTFVEGFHIYIPDWLSMDYQSAATKLANPDSPGNAATVLDLAPHLFGYPIVLNLVTVGIVTVITLVLVWGVRESARFNAVMVSIKLVVLTFFIIYGWRYVNFANWKPFAPNGWAGISSGAAIVFFAYIGFDAVSTVAEETKNPKRNLPIGIIASLIICTLFYIVVAAVFTGLISYQDLVDKKVSEQAEPLTMALKHAVPEDTWAVTFVAFGSVIAHTAVLLVFQLGQTRIFFSMARDGLLPAAFYKLHPRFRTPYISTILIGIVVAAFATVAKIDDMVDLTNIGTLFAFILVCAGIIVLRIKDPDRPRPFRVPGGWMWAGILYALFGAGIWLLPLERETQAIVLIVAAVIFALARNHIFPVLGILTSAYLVYYLPPTSWLRFAAWLNFGFVIYVGYGVIHSRLTGRRYSERPAEHDASTAYTGAWLAIAGLALLLFMRGLDVWQEGFRDRQPKPVATVSAAMGGLSEPAAPPSKPSSFWADSAGALTDIFHVKPWLVVDWFLIVPLTLNAFVLCPIVIRRAWRARREINDRAWLRRTAYSMGVASMLTVATIGYFTVLILE